MHDEFLVELCCQTFHSYQEAIKQNPYNDSDRIEYCERDDFASARRIVELRRVVGGWAWTPQHLEDQAYIEEIKKKTRIRRIKMKILHAPENTQKITEIYAFVSVDKNGNEGVCAFSTHKAMVPMIAADLERLEQFKPIARELAKISPHAIKLIKFHTREEIEEIKPEEMNG